MGLHLGTAAKGLKDAICVSAQNHGQPLNFIHCSLESVSLTPISPFPNFLTVLFRYPVNK